VALEPLVPEVEPLVPDEPLVPEVEPVLEPDRPLCDDEEPEPLEPVLERSVEEPEPAPEPELEPEPLCASAGTVSRASMPVKRSEVTDERRDFILEGV
jgi:hypothetical protein